MSSGTTGYGVASALESAIEVLEELKSLHISKKQIRISIQGFGNVGSFTARFLDSSGIKVVAISDVSGFVHDKDGLNILRLMKDMKGKTRFSDLRVIIFMTRKEYLTLIQIYSFQLP